MLNTFREKVIISAKKIPPGKVVSYGQLAVLAGSPRAARQVGFVLKSLDSSSTNVPWWRVVNSKGEISIKGNWTADKKLQRNLLLKENVKFKNDFQVDMLKCRIRGILKSKAF